MKINYINNLSPERWKEFKRLRLEAVNEDPLAFSSGTEFSEYTEKDWRDRLQKAIDGGSLLVFAETDGKLIGMGSVYLYQIERFKHNASLQGLYVSKNYRGKGVGKELINKRIELILNRNEITQVICEIFSSQIASVELHKKLGFEITGTIKKFVKNGPDFYDSIFLQKTIR